MQTFGITVARRVDAAWECVDDSGRRVVVPFSAVDPALRELRVGQRLVAEPDAAGAVVAARLLGWDNSAEAIADRSREIHELTERLRARINPDNLLTDDDLYDERGLPS